MKAVMMIIACIAIGAICGCALMGDPIVKNPNPADCGGVK